MPQWTADGVPLCVEVGNQEILAIASDGAGGAIVAWQDGRSGNNDIYAQRVTHSGEVAPTVDVADAQPLSFRLDPVRPNPFHDGTTFSFTLPASARVSIAVFDLAGRLVRQLSNGWMPAGGHEVQRNGLDDEGQPVPAGVYVAKARAGGETRALKLERLR